MFNYGLNHQVKKVNCGPTPIKALGATDQHSQIQLYNEGPNDKVINFIRVEEFDNTLEIPHIFDYTGIGYLGGKTINQLINAEADSTRVALSDYKRPTVTISLPKVNAYNQPGVEQAKNYTYALMGRAGYEESAKALKEKMEKQK